MARAGYIGGRAMDNTSAQRVPATMRQHPISPVTEPMQYRAIGVVRGTYVPEDLSLIHI